MKPATPPPTAARPNVRAGKYTRIVSTLQANRDEWYNVTDELDTFATHEAARAFARIVVRGDRKDFAPAGSFEAAADGTDMYMRYVGDPTAPAVTDGADDDEDDDTGE